MDHNYMETPEDILIREPSIGDREVIVDFNIAMARETEGKQLDKNQVWSGVQNLMEHPEYGFYLLAEKNDAAVGSLMITYEWSDWRNGLFWWIQSVYVRPDYRQRGVYRRLHQSVRSMAVNHHEVCGLRLYVEKENTVAREVYRSLGMQPTTYRIFEEEFRSPSGEL